MPSVELLTPPEVAKLLKVKDITLRKWRAAGIGPAYIRVSGGVIRYDMVDIKNHINQQRIGGTK